MHRLVPQFIIERYAQGQRLGRFAAVGLFVDLSGFTTLADALMEHGHHGAEVLTEVLRAVFDPLVEVVHRQGGFTVGFAGDAFTALFPLAGAESEDGVILRALAASWQIQDIMVAMPTHETPYGSHAISAKVGLGRGDVTWGIFEAENAQRAAYYFRGPAVDDCAAAEHHAAPGQIVISPDLLPATTGLATTQPIAQGYHRLSALTSPQPPALPLPDSAPDLALESRFFPAEVITQQASGEFRHVVNVFLSLPTLRHDAQLASFVQAVFEYQAVYGGFIERLDFGDKGCNMLMFWGTPFSYENDIQRALGFILDVQERCAAPVSVGVTYRVAHAGFTGSRLHEGYTCYGRGVSLAARLMMAAPVGSVWMDDEVTQRAQPYFQSEFLGERDFKGFATPQPVYRLVGRAQAHDTAFYQGHMVGRARELAVLAEFVQPLKQGACAGTLIVWGEAGIGKSRLVHDFQDSAFFADLDVAWARCQTDQILRQPFNPFRYWLRGFFDLPEHADMEARRNLFDSRLDELLKAVRAESRHPFADLLAEEVDRTRSFLGALLTLEWPDSLFAQLGPRERHDNTVIALSTLLQLLSLQKPLIILLEDAHWLDDDSLQLWRLLARRAVLRGEQALPLAIIATARPQEGATFLPDEIEFQTLDLGRLSESDLAQLAQALLGGIASPALIESITIRAEGNPFFAEQLLRYLQEQDLLVQTPGGWGVRGAMGDAPLPTDVWNVLAARLDRLTLRVRDVVQTAAVLGREFETPLLAEMRDDEALDEEIAQAARASIWTALAKWRYVFQHALLRDAAYEILLHARRRLLHGLAARAIERIYAGEISARYADLAYHYRLAEEPSRELPYAQLAAEQAAEQYANADAIRLFSRALSLTPPADRRQRFDLISARERVFDLIGDRSAQAADLAELARLADELADEHRRLQISLRLADLGHLTADYESGLRYVTRAAEQAQALDNRDGLAEAYSLRGRILFRRGDYALAQQWTETALELAQARDDQRQIARCLYLIAHIHLSQGRRQQAKDFYAQAQTVYQALNDRRGELNCLLMFGSIERQLGHFSHALEFHGQALGLCRTLGWRLGETIVLQHMGNSYFDLGVYDKAESFHRRALDTAREIGDQEGEANSLDTIGLILHFSGRSAEAVEHHRRALAMQRATSYRRGMGYSLTHLGWSLAALGELAEAATALHEALDLRQSLNPADGALIDDMAGLAWVASLAGDRADAARLAGETLEWLGERGADGVEFPVQAYLVCYRALMQSADDDSAPRDRALAALAAGHELLQQRAAQIEGEHERQVFLQTVPYNRELAAAFAAESP